MSAASQLLMIDSSYFHDANVGHQIKSRALNTIVKNSRIYDRNSTASYSIDLPNGGNAAIQNNEIEQGPNSQNFVIISYGEEGNLQSGHKLRRKQQHNRQPQTEIRHWP